jgi:sugar phosphate isomerase/epimerase
MSNFRTCVALDIFDLDILNLIEKASEGGVSRIQLNITREIDNESIDRHIVKEIIDAVTSNRMIISALSSEINELVFVDIHENSKSLMRIVKMIEMAKDMNSNVVIIKAEKIAENPDQKTIDMIYKTLDTVNKKAKEAAICIAIETGFIKTVLFQTILDELNSEFLRVSYDPSKIMALQSDNPIMTIYHLKKYISNVFFQDVPSSWLEDYSLLNYLKALVDIGFDGHLCVPINHSDGQVRVTRNIEILLAILERIGLKKYASEN